MTITREQVEAYAKAIESCDWTYLFKSSGSKSFRDEAATMLRDLWQRVEAAEATLIDIARMGKKAGSESAKHRLRELGIDWETGEASPDYRSMT